MAEISDCPAWNRTANARSRGRFAVLPLDRLANRTLACEWLARALEERHCRPAVICAGFSPFRPGGDRETTLVRRVSEIAGHFAPGDRLVNFGSGSLRTRDLARCSFDRIKLDPAKMASRGGGRPGTEIGPIVAAARHLAVPVLAQGIETHAAAAAARVQGCAIGQGYLFGRPDRKTEDFRLEGALARRMDFAA